MRGKGGPRAHRAPWIDESADGSEHILCQDLTSFKVMLSPSHDLQMLRTMSPCLRTMAMPPCSHRGPSPPPHTGRSLGPGPPPLTPSRCPRPTLALHGDGQLTGVPTGREGMPLPTSVTP